jgi:hypothetical protein
MKLVRSSPLRTGRLYPQEYPGIHFRGWVDPRAHGTVWCPGKNPRWLGIANIFSTVLNKQYLHFLPHLTSSYPLSILWKLTCQVLTQKRDFCGRSLNTDIRGGSYLNYSTFPHSKFKFRPSTKVACLTLHKKVKICHITKGGICSLKNKRLTVCSVSMNTDGQSGGITNCWCVI